MARTFMSQLRRKNRRSTFVFAVKKPPFLGGFFTAVLAFPGHFGPGVFERNRPVEDGFAGHAVGVGAEVADALELELFAGAGRCQRRFDLGRRAKSPTKPGSNFARNRRPLPGRGL